MMLHAGNATNDDMVNERLLLAHERQLFDSMPFKDVVMVMSEV